MFCFVAKTGSMETANLRIPRNRFLTSCVCRGTTLPTETSPSPGSSPGSSPCSKSSSKNSIAEGISVLYLRSLCSLRPLHPLHQLHPLCPLSPWYPNLPTRTYLILAQTFSTAEIKSRGNGNSSSLQLPCAEVLRYISAHFDASFGCLIRHVTYTTSQISCRAMMFEYCVHDADGVNDCANGGDDAVLVCDVVMV